MSFNTNWDHEKYRTKFESQEHWELKEEFILAHKDRFPKNRLICLAQTYVNIQLLGCRYPKKLMEQVAILSKDTGKAYSENKKTRLQRTFVKASDAANAKITRTNILKRKDSPENDVLQSPPKKLATGKSLANKYKSAVKNSSMNSSPAEITESHESKKIRPIKSSIKGEKWRREVDEAYQNVLRDGRPFAKSLLIFHEHTRNNYKTVLQQFVQINKHQIRYNEIAADASNWQCIVKLDNIAIGSAISPIKGVAKDEACKNAILQLANRCFAVKILKHKIDGEDISLGELDSNKEKSQAEVRQIDEEEYDDAKLSNENIGAKLLKMMGWKGGGLGKDQDGIVNPISTKSVIGRSGLGLKGEVGVDFKFKRKVNEILKNYLQEDTMRDIFFSSELSNEQRKHIHFVARKKPFSGKLKTHSHGKGDGRALVVTKKFSLDRLLKLLVNEGGETDKYKLYPPASLNFDW